VNVTSGTACEIQIAFEGDVTLECRRTSQEETRDIRTTYA
jgi:hypothetical protein